MRRQVGSRAQRPPLLRRNWALAGALGLAGLTLVALRFDEYPVGAAIDDAIYVAMARSLAEGQGPVIKLHPLIPAQRPDVFPLGFPLLLALPAFLFPASLAALKSVPLLATLLLLPVVWRLPPRSAERRLRFWLVFLVFWNPWTVAYAGRLQSEAPYALFSLAALVLYREWTGGADPCKRRLVPVVLLAALAAATRTVGLALPAALIGHLLATRRFRRAAQVAVGVAAALVLLLWLDSTDGPGLIPSGYRAQVVAHHQTPAARLSFMAANLQGYLRELPALMLPVFGKPAVRLADQVGLAGFYGRLELGLGVLLAGLIGLGLGRAAGRARGDQGIFALYLALYGIALLNFAGHPSGVQLRLLLPLLPLLYLFLIEGTAVLIQGLGRRLRAEQQPRRTARIALLVALVVLPMCLVHNLYRVANPLRTAVDGAGFGLVDPSAGSAWVRARTPPGAVVLTQDPLVRRLHFLRPVVGHDATEGELDREALLAHIRQYDVRYVFVGPTIHRAPRRLDAGGERLLGLLRGEPALFEPLMADTLESVYVFAVRSEDQVPR